ncbi:MAG: pantetheine-phosphate adenylyltransferase [Acidimicrobiia bacterium]|nr:pantetheine-phosphate adenylyltransferase [Acidimicrobiia bacterium]
MTTALVPGSFDPPTNGHVDVVGRCADAFDEVIVAVVANPSKAPMFSVDDRVSMLEDLFDGLPGVRVERFEGLLVDFAAEHQANVIVKGLRAVADYEYELQMAQMNDHLTGVTTMFLPTAPQHSYISSSLVKEVARLGGAIDALVPPAVATAMKEL